jgi:hypothetical protein
MMILLATPIVRDCCLPTAHASPLHESGHSDGDGCLWVEQAIETKRTAAAARTMIDYRLSSAAFLVSDIWELDNRHGTTQSSTHPEHRIDLYLRMGTLRI